MREISSSEKEYDKPLSSSFCFDFKYENIEPNYITLDTDIDELYMLSKFKNIIIGNSTFSWWAAYLNNTDSKKTVYCPKNWFNNGCHLNTKDLRPNGWNIMDDDMKYNNSTPFCFDSKKFKNFERISCDFIVSLAYKVISNKTIFIFVYR